MRKLPPLNFGDLVEVKEGFVKGRQGTIIEDDSKDKRVRRPLCTN